MALSVPRTYAVRVRSPANAAIGSFCTIPEWVKNFLKVGNNFIVPKPSREWSDAQTNGIEVSEVKATAPGSANS